MTSLPIVGDFLVLLEVCRMMIILNVVQARIKKIFCAKMSNVKRLTVEAHIFSTKICIPVQLYDKKSNGARADSEMPTFFVSSETCAHFLFNSTPSLNFHESL